MFIYFKKYKLLFKILFVIVFVVGSYLFLHDYFSEVFTSQREKTKSLIGGIISGVFAISSFLDTIYLLRKKGLVNNKNNS